MLSNLLLTVTGIKEQKTFITCNHLSVLVALLNYTLDWDSGDASPLLQDDSRKVVSPPGTLPLPPKSVEIVGIWKG